MSELTEEIRTDARRLFTELVDFARSMLDQYGEFLPFARAINKDGKLEIFNAYTGSEQPKAGEIYALLEAGLTAAARAGKIRAAGSCASVTINHQEKQIQALCIVTEHVGGPAASTLMPFRFNDQGTVEFGKAKTRPIEHTLCRVI